MKKYDRQDQRLLAIWAADTAERVLPFFEKKYPGDDRPRNAIEVCRKWVRTGVFKMSEIRGASLKAHDAARQALTKEGRKNGDNAACFAARAAGQAVATAHVPQHAFGAAYYALKAILAVDPLHATENLIGERDWQLRHLPEHLMPVVIKTILIQKAGNRVVVKFRKGEDY